MNDWKLNLLGNSLSGLIGAVIALMGQAFLLSSQLDSSNKEGVCVRTAQARMNKLEGMKEDLTTVRNVLNEVDLEIQRRADRVSKEPFTSSNSDQDGVELRVIPKIKEVETIAAHFPAEARSEVLSYTSFQKVRLTVLGSKSLYEKLGDHHDTDRRKHFETKLSDSIDDFRNLKDLSSCN